MTRRHGVFPAAAAKLKRRAGVSATSSKTPNTRLKLFDFKASSNASSVSLARAVSTSLKPRWPAKKQVSWLVQTPSASVSTHRSHPSAMLSPSASLAAVLMLQIRSSTFSSGAVGVMFKTGVPGALLRMVTVLEDIAVPEPDASDGVIRQYTVLDLLK